tara:strand:- start:224 stop:490 length:267 start_codon:yes stop_codon:yes gene_type:complete
MYKKNDIVLVKNRFVKDMPLIHVRLLKKHVVAPRKGKTFDDKGFIGWDAELTKRRQAEMLRKKWRIPFKFPDSIDTFVFEEDIVKKAK